MNTKTESRVADLLEFLERLDAGKIWHRLDRVRDAILVEVSVPGEKWEIEFFPDGHVEVERYRSDGQIGGRELLEELFRDFSD